MGNILFIMGNSKGHLHAAFRLGRLLQLYGYRPVFVCQTLRDRAYITSKGFRAVWSENYLLANPFMPGEGSFRPERWMEKAACHLSGDYTTLVEDALAALQEAIAETEPELILIDTMMSYWYRYLPDTTPPVILLESMLSTVYDRSYPPLNSYLSVSDQVAYPLLNTLSWWGCYAKKLRLNWRKWWFRLFFSYPSGQVKLRPDLQERSDKLFSTNFTGLRELVLAPLSFEFTGKKPAPRQCYAGDLLPERSAHAPVDPVFEAAWNGIRGKGYERLVYCSLGTLSDRHFGGGARFLQRVIDAFAHLPGYGLIISKGGEMTQRQFVRRPDNVHFFDFVPQSFVLDQVDLMIAHGGLNSILECIHFQVPMLIYPLNGQWDQPGNSARVVFHGLGQRGLIRYAGVHTIRRQVQSIFSSYDQYKRNLALLSDELAKERDPEKVVRFLESAIPGRQALTSKVL